MFSMTEIHDASLENLSRWWRNPSETPGDFEEDDALDEIAYGLSQHAPEGVRVLKDFLHDKTHRGRAALWFLAWPELVDDEIREALAAAFDSDDTRTKYTALLGHIHAKHFVLSKAQIAGCKDPGNQRLAALAMVYQCRANPENRIEILKKALAHTNPRMREYACDEIGDFGIKELAPHMIPLLNDAHQDVAESAKSNSEIVG